MGLGGQTVIPPEHRVGSSGQRVRSVTGHWVAASGQRVSSTGHSVGAPKVGSTHNVGRWGHTVRSAPEASGQSVGCRGHIVCRCGHSVTIAGSGHWVTGARTL